MAQLEEILARYRSGDTALADALGALEQMRGLGQVDESHLRDVLQRLVAAGSLSPEDAALLAAGPVEPQPVADATMYRPTGAATPVPPAAPTPSATPAPMVASPGTATPGDTSGSVSAGWREWAGAEKGNASIGVGAVLRDRFVIEQAVGEGGMGLVFRARDRRREEARDRHPFVAIKVLGEDFKSHPDSLIALQREARRMQQLSHPNIASVYDFDRDGPHVYLVMELLEGESLDRVLGRHAGVGLPLDLTRKVLEGTASALKHAHSRGLVHSDFKPANVFITSSGEVKVIDFGIARIAKDSTQAGDSALTVFDAGQLGAWTNAYASPEQMLDSAIPDPRDDVYSMALVTYEMLMGKHPFGRKSAVEARYRSMKADPVPALSERQNAVLASALHFERESRLADPMALARALALTADDEVVPQPGIRPERAGHQTEPVPRRNKQFRNLALGIVAVAWLGFFAMYWNSRERPDAPDAPVAVESEPAGATVATTAAVSPQPLPAKQPAGKSVPGATKAASGTNVTKQAKASVPAMASAPAVDAAGSAEPSVDEAAPQVAAGAPGSTAPVPTEPTDTPGQAGLYRWVDGNGTVQFGETPPPEFAASAVKVMDL